MIDILIIGGIVGSLLVVVGLVTLLVRLRRRPRRLKPAHFQEQWHAVQLLCASKHTWPQAVIEADNLLDEALKKKRFSGKTMGERLTHAQRLLSNNEDVWFGHKLRNKLVDDPKTKVKKADVKRALLGIRQALKDLGALPDAKPDAKSEQAAQTAQSATTKPTAKSSPEPEKRPTKALPATRRTARVTPAAAPVASASASAPASVAQRRVPALATRTKPSLSRYRKMTRI